MSMIQSLRSAAALMLKPAASGMQERDAPLAGNSVLASANGMKLVVDPATKQAQVKVSEVLFESDRVSTLALKVYLTERAAEALGVRKDGFASDTEYRAAIKKAFAEISLKPDARRLIDAIEKDLGLDKLGVSLKTLIDAVAGEDPEANEKLDAALGKYAERSEARDGQAGLRISDIGIYQP